MLSNDAAFALLKDMLEEMKTKESIYKPASFWEAASNKIISEVEEKGFDNFRSIKSILSFFVPTYGVPGNAMTQDEVQLLEQLILKNTSSNSKKHATLMQMLSGELLALSDYRVYMAGDEKEKSPGLNNLSESKIGNPAEHFCFDNKWVSRSFLNYINGICFLKKHVDCSNFSTVLEIGGGYGTLGEILYQIGNYSYINVDIPPTAAFSSYYLSNIINNDFIDYFSVKKMDVIPIPDRGKQMVICPWQLPKVTGNVDLFVNYISFQEMEPEVVKHYLNHVDRLKAKYILLRNLIEGKAKKTGDSIYGVDTPIKGSDYDLFLPNYSLISTNVIPYGFKTVDGFHSELRLYRRL